MNLEQLYPNFRINTCKIWHVLISTFYRKKIEYFISSTRTLGLDLLIIFATYTHNSHSTYVYNQTHTQILIKDSSVLHSGSSLLGSSALVFRSIHKGFEPISFRFTSTWKYYFLSEVIIESWKRCKRNSYLLVRYLIPSLKRTSPRLSNSNLASREPSIDLAISGQAELTTAHIMRVVNFVVPTLPNRRNRPSPSCAARN